MQTEKRIHVSLNEKSVKKLEELKENLQESQSKIIRYSISSYHDKVLNKKEVLP